MLNLSLEFQNLEHVNCRIFTVKCIFSTT